jgi:hypothetical protein
MTRLQIPGHDKVLGTLTVLQAEAQASGRQPSVIALARSLGLANTTFRRNFPDVVAEFTRQAATRRQTPPPPGRYAQLEESNAQLRRENRELRGQLEMAAAVIQRITTENDRLRQELEAAANVTQITRRL